MKANKRDFRRTKDPYWNQAATHSASSIEIPAAEPGKAPGIPIGRIYMRTDGPAGRQANLAAVGVARQDKIDPAGCERLGRVGIMAKAYRKEHRIGPKKCSGNIHSTVLLTVNSHKVEPPAGECRQLTRLVTQDRKAKLVDSGHQIIRIVIAAYNIRTQREIDVRRNKSQNRDGPTNTRSKKNAGSGKTKTERTITTIMRYKRVAETKLKAQITGAQKHLGGPTTQKIVQFTFFAAMIATVKIAEKNQRKTVECPWQTRIIK